MLNQPGDLLQQPVRITIGEAGQALLTNGFAVWTWTYNLIVTYTNIYIYRYSSTERGMPPNYPCWQSKFKFDNLILGMSLATALAWFIECRMVPERSFTNHQREHLPSRVAATKAAANVQQFVEVLKTEEEKWATIPVGGSHTPNQQTDLDSGLPSTHACTDS